MFLELTALDTAACAQPVHDRFDDVFAGRGHDGLDAVARRQQRDALNARDGFHVAERRFLLGIADAQSLAHLDRRGAMVQADQKERVRHGGFRGLRSRWRRRRTPKSRPCAARGKHP